MKTGTITQTYHISRDTLRFYIKKGLLQPDLVNGQYHWGQSDISALENILSLRQLGLSVKAILRIKELHDTQCGTQEQLLENREIVLEEIKNRQKEIRLLQEQEKQLKELLQQIEDRLNL